MAKRKQMKSVIHRLKFGIGKQVRVRLVSTKHSESVKLLQIVVILCKKKKKSKVWRGIVG